MLKTRKRLLLIAKILYQETDKKNLISMSELMECLEVSGCKADKKSIYKDIAAIRETLFPVIYVSNRGYYAVKKGEEYADR